MTEIATIKVMYKPGKYEMIINECDFNEKLHEKIKEKAESKKNENKKDIDTELKNLMGE